MDREEEVAAGVVGDVGPGLEVRGEVCAEGLVRGPRIDHLDARHPLLDEFPEFQGHFQREVLLIDPAVMGPGKFPAVPGVDYHDADAVCNILCGNRVCKDGCNRKNE